MQKKKYANKNIKFLTYKNRLPIKSNSIDSVSMIELIEHIDNKDLTYLLKECSRVLKKNGKVYLSTPNYLSLWPLLEFFLNKISPVNYKHEHINKFDILFYSLRAQSLNESGYVFKGNLEGEEDEYGYREIAETYFSDLIIVDSLFYKEVNKFKNYEKDIKLGNISGVWTADLSWYNGKPKGAALFRQAEKYLGKESVSSNVKKYWNLEKPLDTVYLKLPENYYDIK